MPEQYPYIRVWGKMMGSFDYFIEAQQAKAATMRAPSNTIYITPESDEAPAGVSTTEDILASSVRERFAKECAGLGVPSPWADNPF